MAPALTARPRTAPSSIKQSSGASVAAVSSNPSKLSADQLAKIDEARARRRDAPQRAEWLDGSLKLKQRKNVIEKELQRTLYSSTGELQQLIAGIVEENSAYEESRKQDFQELKGAISNTKLKVVQLKELILHPKAGSQYISKVRKAMDDISEFIAGFRNVQIDHFDSLCRDERLLVRECAEAEKIVDAIENNEDDDPHHITHAAGRPATSHSSTTGPPQLPTEVQAVDLLLKETGGMTGGWNVKDHDSFLKARTQSQGHMASIVKLMKQYAPHIAVDAVEQHEQWFQQYQKLIARKREAIRNWRSHKEEEKRTKIEAVKAEQEDEPGNSSTAGSISHAHAPDSLTPERALIQQQHSQTQKRKIAEWKKKQMEEQRLHIEQEEAARRERKRQEKEKLEQKRAKLHQQLDEMKSRKEHDEALSNVSRPKTAGNIPSQKFDTKLHHQLVSKAIQSAKARKQKAEVVSARKHERQHRLEALGQQVKLGSQVTGDDQRLHRDTAASAGHRRPGDEQPTGYHAIMRGGDVNRPSTIMHRPARATPNWRKV